MLPVADWAVIVAHLTLTIAVGIFIAVRQRKQSSTEVGPCDHDETSTEVYPEAIVEDITAEMAGVLPPQTPAADAPMFFTIPEEGSRDDTDSAPTFTATLPDTTASIFDWDDMSCVEVECGVGKQDNEDTTNILSVCWLFVQICHMLLQFTRLTVNPGWPTAMTMLMFSWSRGIPLFFQQPHHWNTGHGY